MTPRDPVKYRIRATIRRESVNGAENATERTVDLLSGQCFPTILPIS